MRSFSLSLSWVLLCVVASGCDCAGPTPAGRCTTQRDCEASAMCVDGFCVAEPDGGFADAGNIDGGGISADAGPCGASCRRCRFDVCVPDLGTCTTNDDCPGDSYCSGDGECLPYGVPPDVTFDPMCQRTEVLDEVRPVLQCEWNAPAAGDIEPRSSWVYTAPMIADLNLDEDPGRLQPSVILTTWYSSPAGELNDRIGMLRIFDGRTCGEQLHFGGPDDLDNRPAYGSQWAIADLDGDVGTTGGRPELVGLHRTGGLTAGVTPTSLYAIAIDVAGGVPTARRLWYGRDCTTDTVITFGGSTSNPGPSIADLDDDGDPEIIMNEMVFDHEGCLLNTASASSLPQLTNVDVDGDGRIELVGGRSLLEWDPSAGTWVPEPYFVTGLSHQINGHIAVVDLGAYSVLPDQPLPNELPEIIVVGSGTIRALALDGSLIFGPVRLHLDPMVVPDAGGPPTASDFDGDGFAEFAAAARDYYMVFDPDCVSPGGAPERVGGRCDRSAAMAGMPAGVLWAQPSREVSSGITGSSIFDFDGNGSGEVVYRDECYLRVYAGGTGEVIFSAPATSGTGLELPTIADVDGDFATEIVVPRTLRTGCPTTDPLFPASGDLVQQAGFVIYRDPMDRWASSRPIWNQYAYSITHITDDGRVVRTSEWRRNWTVPGLNNFRQNVQGDTGLLNIADLTVVFQDVSELCTTTFPAELTLPARVCNRGTNPVGDGVLLQFVELDAVVCETRTTRFLLPGECEELSCSGTVASAEELFVRVDPNDEIADCRPGNDEGVTASRLCLD